MKRGIIGIFLLVLLVNIIGVYAVVSECSDSDGGNNLYVKGTSILGDNSCTDSCYSNDQYVNECYCGSSGMASMGFPCPNGCVDGACINQDVINCNSDDDCGRKTIEKYCSQKELCIKTVSPSCVHLTTSSEGYCSNLTNINCSVCSNGCLDGACLNETICFDSDYGVDITKKGYVKDSSGIHYDFCSDNKKVGEKVCLDGKMSIEYKECPNDYSCSEGVCVLATSTCFDSDNGIDIFTKGYAKDATGIHNDFCSDNKKIGEKICKDGKNYIEYKECPEGYSCKDGVCISGATYNSGEIKLNEKFKINLKETKVLEGNIKVQFIGIGPNSGVVLKFYIQSLTTDAIHNGIELQLEKGKKVEYSGYYIELLELNDNVAIIIIGKNEVVNENVKCLFKNSETEEKCFTASYTNKENFRYDCVGISSCDLEIGGFSGEKIIWKSSCGGYSYTKIDGINEEITFDCSKGESDMEKIKDKGFRYMYYQCYDGFEEKVGSESSCKSSELWKQYAREACKGRCKKESEKCGVNSFSVHGDCYDEKEENSHEISCENKDVNECCSKWALENGINVPSCVGGWNIENNKCFYSCKDGEETIPEDVLVCKDSCPYDGKCYQFGYRKSSKYCTDKGSFEEQLSGNKVCENNFECKSNVCVSGKCVSQGMIDRILAWFKNVFGKDE